MKKVKRNKTNKQNKTDSVLGTSLGKTIFGWRFILNENILF